MQPLPAGLTAQGLDLGSNTFSFCELSTGIEGFPCLVADASVPVRLSEGLAPGGRLKPVAIARGLAALESYKERFALKPQSLRAVGTAVLRLCSHPEDFTTPAAEWLGVPVEIISGHEEARLTFGGATLGLPAAPEGRWITLDIGGQSTEVGWLGPQGFESHSLPLGVVSLTETLVSSDPPTAEQAANLRSVVRRQLELCIPASLSGTLLCVAGTATTLGAVALALTRWDRAQLHGLSLSQEELAHWTHRMLEVSSSERVQRYGVSPGRADVFPVGLILLEEVLGHLGKTRFTISASGLRVGVALGLLRKESSS